MGGVETAAWLRAALLFEMHATAGSQLPDYLCLQSSQASEGGEGYRVCALRLWRLCKRGLVANSYFGQSMQPML